MHSPRVLAVTALGTLAIAGCGSSSSSSSTASTATPAATTQAAAATTTAAKPTTAKKVAVTIKNFEFGPTKTVVAKGATVTWTNKDTANHTVTFDAGSMKSLGNMATGTKRSMRFTKAGTYAYHCDYHPNMHGTVVVR